MRLSLIYASSSLIAATAANAQSGPVGFQSPSKNIACAYFDYDNQNTLRCDIMEATVTARRPADCDLEWGKAFEMRSKGGADAPLLRRHGDGPQDCRCWPMAKSGSAAGSPARRSRRA